jgi:hypothetical protein
MLRCSRHQNFSIVARCSPHAVAIEDRRVVVGTSRGRLAFDYLIVCTGFTVDWSRRPELASLAPHVVLWRHRFQPDDRDIYDQVDDPFLGGDETAADGPAASSADPRVAELRRQRRAIEEKIGALKERKDAMESALYEDELEKLLVELARSEAALRQREGAR